MWLCINFILHTEHIVIAVRKLHSQIKIGLGVSHQGRKILGLHCPAVPPPPSVLKDYLPLWHSSARTGAAGPTRLNSFPACIFLEVWKKPALK